MNVWIRVWAMTLLGANVIISAWLVITSVKPVPQCINGMVMIPSRDHSMYVQSAVIVAERCVAIDTD